VLLTPPLFNPNFGVVPVAPDRPCWTSMSAWALSYLAVKLFSKYSNMITVPKRYRQTDRQQTTCNLITVLCVASRGKMAKIGVHLGKLSQNKNRGTSFWTTRHPVQCILPGWGSKSQPRAHGHLTHDSLKKSCTVRVAVFVSRCFDVGNDYICRVFTIREDNVQCPHLQQIQHL